MPAFSYCFQGWHLMPAPITGEFPCTGRCVQAVPAFSFILQGSNLGTACCPLTRPICPPCPSKHTSWVRLVKYSLQSLSFVPTFLYHHGPWLLWETHSWPSCPVSFPSTWLSWDPHLARRYLVPSCYLPENFLVSSGTCADGPHPALFQLWVLSRWWRGQL